MQPPSERRERIMLYGDTGTGKTKCAFDVALMAADTDSKAHFYYLDLDSTAEAFLDNEDYAALENITLVTAFDWEDVKEATKELVAECGPEDWLVIDGAGNMWDSELRRWWIEKAHGLDVADYLSAVRQDQVESAKVSKDGKSHTGTEFGGQETIDWNYLKAVYQPWEQSITLKAKGHKLWITAGKEPYRQGETMNPILRRVFDRVPLIPVGQKDAPFRFHTILYTQSIQEGRFTFTTIKDREREEIKGKSLASGFAMAYLKDVGKWKM